MKSAALKNAFALRHKVSLYIPGTVDANTAGDTSEFVNKAAALLSECFGGATSTPALGYWVSSVHGLISERNNIVFAYAAENDLEKYLDSVVQFAATMRDALKQEAVALELDGAMYFI